jgi:serine/threonine-protein phosphatase 2A regulatory subunit A
MMAWNFFQSYKLSCVIFQVLEKINNPHYLYRMTILQAISLLAPVMGAEITCQKLLPVVINSSKDR